jgi:hypothetical protein
MTKSVHHMIEDKKKTRETLKSILIDNKNANER